MSRAKTPQREERNLHDLRQTEMPIYNDSADKLAKCRIKQNLGKKRSWTNEEDAYLAKLVQKYGPQKWTFIAENLPGRIGKQCRQRWHNHLSPHIKKEEWSQLEEWTLFLSHKAMGNKWADIANYLLGRTDNSIKNHWNSSMKKKIPELQQKYRKIKVAFISGNTSVLDKMTHAQKQLFEKTHLCAERELLNLQNKTRKYVKLNNQHLEQESDKIQQEESNFKSQIISSYPQTKMKLLKLQPIQTEPEKTKKKHKKIRELQSANQHMLEYTPKMDKNHHNLIPPCFSPLVFTDNKPLPIQRNQGFEPFGQQTEILNEQMVSPSRLLNLGWSPHPKQRNLGAVQENRVYSFAKRLFFNEDEQK